MTHLMKLNVKQLVLHIGAKRPSHRVETTKIANMLTFGRRLLLLLGKLLLLTLPFVLGILDRGLYRGRKGTDPRQEAWVAGE
jgi:hypothetical protein